jgi:hypothetical protein
MADHLCCIQIKHMWFVSRIRTARKRSTVWGIVARTIRKRSLSFRMVSSFHWKLDTTGSRTYSIKPEDYPRLPLFKMDPAAPEQCVLLNQVFWLVFDDSLSWRPGSIVNKFHSTCC